jgi:hypothetical protein
MPCAWASAGLPARSRHQQSRGIVVRALCCTRASSAQRGVQVLDL